MDYANVWVNSRHAASFTNSNLIETTLISFQISCQVSKEDDGHCIWHGICSQEDTTKNCAYDGPAKPLDASGIVALKQWCSHLLPQNYTEGQDVLTCCDNEQVSSCQLFSSFRLSTTFPSVGYVQRQHPNGCEPSKSMSIVHEQSCATYLWVHLQSTPINVC